MTVPFVDVPYLKAACGWGRYRTRKGRTRYGVLNVPVRGQIFAFDFSPDRNGDVSVNVRKHPRDLDREVLKWLPDFRGFIISKKGWCRPLNENRANHRERRNSRKSENWRCYAMALNAHLGVYKVLETGYKASEVKKNDIQD